MKRNKSRAPNFWSWGSGADLFQEENIDKFISWGGNKHFGANIRMFRVNNETKVIYIDSELKDLCIATQLK